MAIELVQRFLPLTDELFATESKASMLTNQSFSWDGAATVKVYAISTSGMHDYGRSGPADGNWSRYGKIDGLDATTQSFTIRKDRSFTFSIDKLDEDETAGQMAAATALARQLREVVVPEVDEWVYRQMCEHAGQKKAAVAITAANLYDLIIEGTNALDNAEAPDAGRVLVITPDVHRIMKQSRDIILETVTGNDMRIKGVIGMLDGMNVIRVPASRVPADFGFMIAHPVATVAPVKLADYRVHRDPPGISGSLVEGRLTFDAFVLKNKADALYYQAKA